MNNTLPQNPNRIKIATGICAGVTVVGVLVLTIIKIIKVRKKSKTNDAAN